MTKTRGVVSGTTPYAWPWDGALDASRLALIIAGSQHDWFAVSQNPQETADTIRRVASTLHARGGIVIAVIHSMPQHRGDLGPAAIKGDRTNDSVLGDCPLDRRIDAAGIDGFYGSRLDAELRSLGRDQLLFTGFGLETAVHSTLRSANDRGYECLTLVDACAPLDSHCGERALHGITMSGGIFGAIGESTALIDALSAIDPIPTSIPSSPS